MTIYCADVVEAITKPLACCEAWVVSVEDLSRRETEFFRCFMPMARSAIVLGHHVRTEEEWQWYASANDNEFCAADDHALAVCKGLQLALEEQGFSTEIVPYPRESGLQFRFVALAAGAGTIGTNAFLLHPTWGPWIQLRVLATEVPVAPRKKGTCTQVCNACGVCVEACPAGAIQEAGFDGLLCRSYRQAKGEYTPVGLRQELRYCLICAQCCPIGARPRARVGTEKQLPS